MKNETLEERDERLYISKAFGLQGWGNRYNLYLFAYSIHYKNDDREETRGAFLLMMREYKRIRQILAVKIFQGRSFSQSLVETASGHRSKSSRK